MLARRLKTFSARSVETSISEISHNYNFSDRTDYTWATQALGVADTNRFIVVAVGVRSNGGNISPSSVTVGGETASKIVSAYDGGRDDISLWIASVPTGTTGDIVVNFGTQPDICCYAAWRLIHTDGIPLDYGISMTAGTPGTETVLGGIAIGFGFEWNGGGASAWTGATEWFDIDMNTSDQYTAATNTFTSAGANTLIYPNGVDGRLCVSWS